MQATILDLRYHMKKVLQALERNEKISILYHGKIKGIIIPVNQRSSLKVKDHPMFGMNAKKKESVLKEMEKLRGGRFDDI